MKTSELIKKLQALIDSEGDLDVVTKIDLNSLYGTNPLVQDAFLCNRRLFSEEKCVMILS